MRTVLKVALAFLIFSMSAVAQDHALPGQPALPVQSPEAQSFTPPAETATETNTIPSPPSIRIPVLVQSNPAYIYLPRQKRTPTVITGYAGALNVSAGFSVTSFGLPSSGRAALAGVNGSVATDAGKRFGAKLDISYERNPNLYHSGQPMDALTYLIGPVFYPSNGSLLSTSLHLLFGGARVAGPFPNGTGGLNLGHVNYPAWAVGGGFEYRLSPGLGFRLSVDYLHTHFYNSSEAVRGQNDVRVVNSLVYYLGKSLWNH